MPHPDRASLPIAPAKYRGKPGCVRRHVGQLLGREPARIDRAELVKDWLLPGVLLLLDNVTVDETVPRRGGCLVFGVVGFGGAELRFVLDEGRFEINDPLLFGEWSLLRVASGGAGQRERRPICSGWSVEQVWNCKSDAERASDWSASTLDLQVEFGQIGKVRKSALRWGRRGHPTVVAQGEVGQFGDRRFVSVVTLFRTTSTINGRFLHARFDQIA